MPLAPALIQMRGRFPGYNHLVPGFMPGTHVFFPGCGDFKTWVAETSPAKGTYCHPAVLQFCR